MARTGWLLCFVPWLAGTACRAERVDWYSSPAATNLTSTGAPMGAGFSFELGVFTGSFVPTTANTAQWAANWVPAQRIAYIGQSQSFGDQFTVADNTAPFTVGKPAYIWGFQAGASSSEWILFRKAAWTWPAPNPMNPIPLDWNAASATAIIGTIDPDGSPFLMKSAAVTDAASPPTSWQQWRAAELSGVANGANDDPDHDGSDNLLEFVFGSPPKLAGAPPATLIEIVTISSHRFLQATIPRRIDHPSLLTVEVSSDLTNWNSGPAAIVVVSDTPASLVVRDLTPLGPDSTGRFMRLKSELPPP